MWKNTRSIRRSRPNNADALRPSLLRQDKKNRACGAAKSREETPKEGIYSHKWLQGKANIAAHNCQARFGHNWCGAPKHTSAELPKNARFRGSFEFLRHVLRKSVAGRLSHLPNGAIFTDFIAEDFSFKKMCHKHKQPSISQFS
jgi:hypothetical protein